MPPTLTPDDLAARTYRAVAAATATGRDLGLEVSDPAILHDVFSVVVHLKPSPVVVRVPTVLPPSDEFATQVNRQRTELDVVGWLADHGHPVVAPSPLVPRKPVQRDGFSMTFWQFVEQVPNVEPDYAHNSGLTAKLHAALREYPGELPFLSSLLAAIPDGISRLETRPDLIDPVDLDRAQREWSVLEPVLASRAGFEAAFPDVPLQAIHGDAPPFNIIPTTEGKLYADFELAAFGPVEWDLTLSGAEGEANYNATARALGLRPLDERVLRVMEAAGLLQAVACLALVPQLPMLAEGLAPILETWRTTPFAGGMS